MFLRPRGTLHVKARKAVHRGGWLGITAVMGTAAMLVTSYGTVGAQAVSKAGRDPVTLEVVEWTNPPAIQATNRLDRMFHKLHPNITVKLEDAPTENNGWTTLSNTSLASKKVDVLATYAPGPTGWPPAYTKLKLSGDPALAQAGELTNLANQPLAKRLTPGVKASSFTHDGKLYGAQAATYVWAGDVFYKKSLLAKYHMKVPTTYKQFISDCNKFKSHGITPVFVAGGAGAAEATWWGAAEDQLLVQQHPGLSSLQLTKLVDKEFWDGKLKWTSPVFKQAAKKFEKIFSYAEPDASGLAQLSAPGTWAAQANNYPFFDDGSWDGLTIHQANPKLKFGEFELPTTNDPKANVILNSLDLTWMVPTWAPQHKAALEWLNFFFQPKNYQIWLNLTGSLPTETTSHLSRAPWMSWYDSRSSKLYAQLVFPFVPAGAGPYAGSPDVGKMKPFGNASAASLLAQSAHQYAAATRKH